MRGTNCSNLDSIGAKAGAPGERWLGTTVAAGLLLAIGIGLVVWNALGTRRQVARLRTDFAGANLESFFLGVHLREAVLRMNGALFRFQLSDDASERAGFDRDVADVVARIEGTKRHLATESERQLVDQIERAFALYQVDAEAYLERGLRGIRKHTAGTLHRELSLQSAPLVALANRLVSAQQSALHQFLGSAQNALSSLQRQFVVSVILLILLVASLAALLQRTKVARLRARLQASQQIIERQEKLASLGVLAAGVAHEIRNPLTAIKFRLFSLTRELPQHLSENEDLAVVHGEINRLEKIVRDFLQFARPAEPQLAAFPAADFLTEIVRLLGAELERRSIRIKVEPTDPLPVRADRAQLKQVFINLVQNAADSIAGGGFITLRARPATMKVPRSTQPMISIEVSDTGPGMPPDVEQRVFDPFFSTKEGGTGLGLPIAARIVEKHGGFIQYVTQPGRGTTFSVVLPADPSHESATPPDRR